jgi:hypothetical protein
VGDLTDELEEYDSGSYIEEFYRVALKTVRFRYLASRLKKYNKV